MNNTAATNLPSVAAPSTCLQSTHDRMKADPELFLACPFVGIQRIEEMPALIMRNCPRCSSTLALDTDEFAALYQIPVATISELVAEYTAVRS